MALDPDFKKITLAFGKAANAQAFAKKMDDHGYSREPIYWRGTNVLELVFKKTLEHEVLAAAKEYRGYVPQAARPVWPPQDGDAPRLGRK